MLQNVSQIPDEGVPVSVVSASGGLEVLISAMASLDTCFLVCPFPAHVDGVMVGYVYLVASRGPTRTRCQLLPVAPVLQDVSFWDLIGTL